MVLWNKFLLGAGLVLVLAMFAGGWWYVNLFLFPASEPRSAYRDLVEDNPTFARAEELFAASWCTDSFELYKSVLSEVSDDTQKGQVEFKIALCAYGSGNYREAIPLFKKVGATSAYDNFIRAYSVQYLGTAYYYGDPAITAEIFKDEPYRSLWVEGDIRLSYRHLFEYASVLYPLALSELYVADWYAERLATASSSKPAYMTTIRGRLALAEQDIERVRDEPSQRYTFLNALVASAVLLAKVEQAGEPPLGDTEGAFREVLQLYVTNNLPYDGTARFQYALYLAKKYGNVRAADIRALLAPLNEDLSAHSISWGTFIKNERARATQPNPNLLLLASIDPGFKKLLLSLGWKEIDFAQ